MKTNGENFLKPQKVVFKNFQNLRKTENENQKQKVCQTVKSFKNWKQKWKKRKGCQMIHKLLLLIYLNLIKP